MTPITCLSKLYQQLQKTSEPFSVINLYNGNDWHKLVSPYSTSLWSNDYMDLRLKSWKIGQPKLYNNNYSTVHTKVLDGKFIANLKLKDLEFYQYLHKDDYTTFHSFSSVVLKYKNRYCLVE